MGAVIEFKRPAPAPAKPADPQKREWRWLPLDFFDEATRYLSNPDVSYESRVKFINDWREHWGMERLECAETRHE